MPVVAYLRLKKFYNIGPWSKCQQITKTLA
jgi:hypothetical protein